MVKLNNIIIIIIIILLLLLIIIIIIIIIIILQAISYDLFVAMIHKNELNDSMLLYL